MSPLSPERKREYQREYMRSRRGSNKRPAATNGTAPKALSTKTTSKTAGSNKEASPGLKYVDNEAFWLHPNGRVFNFPPDAALPKDVLDWRDR
jgi:hypothetical protein